MGESSWLYEGLYRELLVGVPSHEDEDAGESAILCSPRALSKEEALMSFCTTLEEEGCCALEQEESMVETFINMSSRGKEEGNKEEEEGSSDDDVDDGQAFTRELVLPISLT